MSSSCATDAPTTSAFARLLGQLGLLFGMAVVGPVCCITCVIARRSARTSISRTVKQPSLRAITHMWSSIKIESPVAPSEHIVLADIDEATCLCGKLERSTSTVLWHKIPNLVRLQTHSSMFDSKIYAAKLRQC